MKTKNILRTFFAVVFMMGAMAMNAQTKLYVVNKNGTTDTYNIDDVKRITVNTPRPGPNLLDNPGFEDEDNIPDGSTATVATMPDAWLEVPDSWFVSFYGTETGRNAASTPNRATVHWFTVTYPGMLSLLTGKYAARVPGNATGGMYQIISGLTPGETYEYGCDIAFRDNTGNDVQKINTDLAVKILKPDGAALGGGAGITYLRDFTPSSVTGIDATPPAKTYRQTFYKNVVKGEITLPAGVTSVRFQVDQKDFTSATPSAPSTVMVWDQCFFRLKEDFSASGPVLPGTVNNIVDFGASPSKTSDENKAAIQAAIDALPANGTVYVPAGTFTTKPFKLKSNMTLYLEEGAVIKGTTNWRDYATGNLNNGKEGWLWEDCFVKIPDDSQNITIDGNGGTIDGSNCQNLQYGENGNRGPHIFHILRCTNLTVRNITLKNSGNYAFRFDFCNNVLYENLTILRGWDGIHSQTCENVTIRNCTLKTRDTNIAGTGNKDWLIENTSLLTNGGGMLVGCLNLTVQNCHFGGDFDDANCFKGGNFPHQMANAIRFFSPNGRNNRFDSDNWLIKDCTVDQVGRFFFFNRVSEGWQVDKGMKSVRFENIKATNMLANDPAQGGSYGGQTINFVDDLSLQPGVRQFKVYMDNCQFQWQSGATGAIITAADFDSIEIHNSSFTGGVAGRAFISAKNGNILILDNVTGNGGAINTTNINQVIK